MTSTLPPRDTAPAASRRSNHRRPLHIRAPLMALFVVGAVCTVVATYILHTGADQTTAGTLLVFGPRRFVPIAWLVGAVVMTMLGWRWVLASLAMAAFSLFAFSGFSVPTSGTFTKTAKTASSARTFRLVSFNVDDARNIDFLFEQAIPRWDADVIVFQACVSDAERALLRALPPSMRMRRIGEFCVASAHPVVGGALIPINPPQISGRQAYAVHLRIEIAEDTVSVVAVHLASPRDELRAALQFDFSKLQISTTTRALQAERLSRYLSNIREPVAIAGDFNTLEDSQIYKKYFGNYTNAFGAISWGFGHTMQGGFHRLRIDHVLTGAGMRPLSVNTEWNWPTEHRPVVVTLAF